MLIIILVAIVSGIFGSRHRIPLTELIRFASSPKVDSLSFCDAKTQTPCNSPFFKHNCDFSACTILPNEQGHERTVCTCLNYSLKKELNFLENVMQNPKCFAFRWDFPHDSPDCLKRCDQLQTSHQLEAKLNPLYTTAQKRVYGCRIDVNQPTGSATSRGSGQQHHFSHSSLHCFCYTGLPILIQHRLIRHKIL